MLDCGVRLTSRGLPPVWRKGSVTVTVAVVVAGAAGVISVSVVARNGGGRRALHGYFVSS